MKKQILSVSAAFALVLAGCGATTPKEEPVKSEETSNDEMAGMDHSSDGSVPGGIMEAKNPTYLVGSKATIETDHMEGMKGATATIVGAFDTIAYSINYTPTNGGERVMDHKWVVHEEIENPTSALLEKGTEVTVRADHMEGMEGAKAEIESAEQTTVYMIDYESTIDGKEVKNHKWVVEDELSNEAKEQVVDIKELVNDYTVRNAVAASASITSSELIVTGDDKEVTTYELPEDEFFVSIAPFESTTHPCDIHSLTGCQGELVEEDFDVHIEDSKGNVVLDEKKTTAANGFIDLWLPHNDTFTVTITQGNKETVSEITTFDGDNTCITTMQLK